VDEPVEGNQRKQVPDQVTLEIPHRNLLETADFDHAVVGPVFRDEIQDDLKDVETLRIHLNRVEEQNIVLGEVVHLGVINLQSCLILRVRFKFNILPESGEESVHG